jgi:decaprenylphospho-beta-D-erythro-pentofuranosid-2-ulose 2-reductase
MGRAVARELVAQGHEVFLIGRHEDDLVRSARDLELRGRATSQVGTARCDLERPDTFEPALDAAARAMGRLDAVVVTAARFATQEALEADPAATARLLTVNFTNTVLFCEQARRRLLSAGGGTLCVFSSVAGDRGRTPVVLYGASKAGLSRYLEGLDHRYRVAGLRTVCVKPGFVRTGMTQGQPEPPFAGDSRDVARCAARLVDVFERTSLRAMRCLGRWTHSARDEADPTIFSAARESWRAPCSTIRGRPR